MIGLKIFKKKENKKISNTFISSHNNNWLFIRSEIRNRSVCSNHMQVDLESKSVKSSIATLTRSKKKLSEIIFFLVRRFISSTRMDVYESFNFLILFSLSFHAFIVHTHRLTFSFHLSYHKWLVIRRKTFGSTYRTLDACISKCWTKFNGTFNMIIKYWIIQII